MLQLLDFRKTKLSNNKMLFCRPFDSVVYQCKTNSLNAYSYTFVDP